MAGANNKSLKAAGFKPAAIKVIRSTGGAGLSIRSAIGHAQQHGVAIPAKAAEHAPTGWQKAAERSGMTGWQKAANDSREKRVAAMQAARGAPQTGWQRASAGLKVEAGPATRKAKPKFDTGRHLARRVQLRNALQNKAIALSKNVSDLRVALSAADKRRNTEQYSRDEPRWADIRGKNRADRERKFYRAKREHERPTRRYLKIQAILKQRQGQLDALFRRTDRARDAVTRLGG